MFLICFALSIEGQSIMEYKKKLQRRPRLQKLQAAKKIVFLLKIVTKILNVKKKTLILSYEKERKHCMIKTQRGVWHAPAPPPRRYASALRTYFTISYYNVSFYKQEKNILTIKIADFIFFWFEYRGNKYYFP